MPQPDPATILEFAHLVIEALDAAQVPYLLGGALAAGGPIMPPEMRNILIVAVAPHLSVEQVQAGIDNPALLQPRMARQSGVS